MKYTVEIPLRDFEFWGGAKSKAQLLTPSQLDQIDDVFSVTRQPSSEDYINNLFWFEFDYIATLLGFEDGDDLERAARGESGESDE